MVTEEFNRLRELPEFALDNYNNSDPNYSQDLTNRVIEAARIPAATVAVLAFWGDRDTDRWWTQHLERLARVTRYSGTAWLINLPLIATSMLYYAAGVAAVCRENYARLVKVFALRGEPINVAGPVPLSQMLRFNATMMRLTPAQHHQALRPTLTEALGLLADVIDDAWQLFEILRLASQLMQSDQFDSTVAKRASADAQRDAIGSIDQTAAARAEATKNSELNGLAAQCQPRGLYLCAVEQVYTPGTGFRWGSPIAERLAEEINRERDLHPLVRGLDISPERIELALRAVSRAIGDAGYNHPTNKPDAAGVMPDKVWLDT